MSELTGQTIPITVGISLLIKTIQPDQSDPKIVCIKEMAFQQKTLGKSLLLFHFDWSDHGLAGQF